MVKDDPNASVGQVIVLTVAAVVFVALAVRLYRPLFGRHVVEGRPFGWTEAGQRAGRPGGAGPGFQGMAKGREHRDAPVADRRTNDRLSDAQRAFNRGQAGLRALVEQSMGYLADAWA